jgi:ZIP family zinc transporter
MSAVAQAALLVSLPVAAGAIGSTVAAVGRPGPRLVSGIQHFAAGVVTAALAGELLSDLRHEGNLGWAAAGFTAGVALVLGLAAYGRRLDGQRESAQKSSAADHIRLELAALSAACAGVSSRVDGFLPGHGRSTATPST